jgi:hypothetical protein
MRYNVEFGFQLRICSEAKENHEKPCSSWPVARPSGWKLTSSQQSGNKYASLNISPYLCYCFIENIYKLLLQIFLCEYNLDKHQTVCNTCGRNGGVSTKVEVKLRPTVSRPVCSLCYNCGTLAVECPL